MLTEPECVEIASSGKQPISVVLTCIYLALREVTLSVYN